MATTTTVRTSYDVQLGGPEGLPRELIVRRVERTYRKHGRGETQTGRDVTEVLTLTRAQAAQLISELASALSYDPVVDG